jgi:hypothetical protein
MIFGAMARKYNRDSRGRFSSGGGGGGGTKSKAKSGGGAKSGPKTSSARGRALANERKATKAVKAANKSGAVGRKEAKSQLVAQRAREFYQRSGTGTKRSVTAAGKAAALTAKRSAAGKAGAAKGLKTKKFNVDQANRIQKFKSKAPVSAAKAAYKKAKSRSRLFAMTRGGRVDATVKSAKAKVKRLEKSRGLSKTRKSRK